MLLEHFENWTEGRAASEEDVLLCHTPEHIARVRAVTAPEWLDYDTMATASTYEAAMLAAGTAIEAALQGGFALVRPPGHHALARARDGLLRLQQRRGRGSRRTARARHRARGDRRLGRAPRQRDRRDLPRRRLVLFVSLHQWPFYPGTGGPDDQAETTMNIPLRAGSGDEEYMRAFEEHRRARGGALRAGARARFRRLRRARGGSARGDARHRGRLPRARATLRGRSRRASGRSSRAATSSRRCRPSSQAALDGFGYAATAKRPLSGPFRCRMISASSPSLA